MNQEPLQMPSCTPPAALSLSLWPVAVPKNRVGGSAVFSFVFTFQYIGETLDTPGENGDCGYDFASGVHKYLYGECDPADRVDPLGEQSVYVITDAENPGFKDKSSANKVASHLQAVGWTVIDAQPEDFIKAKTSFNGVILSGHGDENQSAAIDIDVLESVAKETGSKLDVIIAMSRHAFDFASKISQDGYTTPTALVVGYWGYGVNYWLRVDRVGRAVDTWAKHPKYTSLYYGDFITTGFGDVGVPLAHGISSVMS
ncbi:MAG: hypothetical protein ACREDS_08665, partial [Limisphaerales bacterium]